MTLRIVITGPESSGKSTLTRHLGATFDLPFALEYARDHLEEHGPEYSYEQLCAMARRHLAYQQKHVPPQTPVGLFDTDLINYKIWFEEVFGRCPESIIAGIRNESQHAYLLCAPDLPWEPDPLRENPNDRQRLFDRHLAEITRLRRPVEIIQGTGQPRQAAAEAALKQLVGNNTF